MRLGFDKQNKEQCYQYVPIIKTIEALLKDTSVKRQFFNPPVSQDGILQDINYGDLIKGNLFFIKFPNAIKVLLVQDAFEVVNPLGSAKKKHKVLAMYATLGNIHPENRSKIHPMQLVLLVREIDLKYFGQNIVFRALVDDLKKLEVGVLVDDQYVQIFQLSHILRETHAFDIFLMLTRINTIFSCKSEKIGSNPTFVLTLLFASKYPYLVESIAIK
ncbi:Hypothetical predicted protein [Paramuricea clavata]|uniref:Uncharacterized protein n=1 Tax=Paramuricea clavata TaxID=317549 RepID=A0A6S7IKY9_PARCT|nr:Hypothetical predicted protein [Paramuricea clavata]